MMQVRPGVADHRHHVRLLQHPPQLAPDLDVALVVVQRVGAVPATDGPQPAAEVPLPEGCPRWGGAGEDGLDHRVEAIP